MREHPAPSSYKPPPRSACDEESSHIELAADDSYDTRYVLFQHIETYRGKVVKFCLELQVHNHEQHETIMRVDSDDGTVHKHLFDRDGGEQRIDLVEIPPHRHDVVTAEYERAYDEIVDHWDERVGRWQQ